MFLENAVSSITHTSNKRHSVLNSPIGKIVVEDINHDFSPLHLMSQSNNKNNTPMLSSLEKILFETDEVYNEGKYNKQLIINIVTVV